MYTITIQAVKAIKSIMLIFLKPSGCMVADVPITNRMLNMLEPIMSPSAICECFLNIATIQVTSSGNDVEHHCLNW